MPRSKTGNKRPPVDLEALKKAIEAINAPPDSRISIREACKVYGVKLATVIRHQKKFKNSGAEQFTYDVKYDVRKVFSDYEEQLLVDYIKAVAKSYKLTKKAVRELAYRFAVINRKHYPSKWDEEKIAGEEWMRLFMKRHTKDFN